MASRYLAIGSLVLMAAVAASSPRPDLVHPHGARAASGAAHLYAVGTRSAAQSRSAAGGKMDSVLADLSRHTALARPDHLMTDLHALSPGARFARRTDGTAMVVIDAVTRGDPQALKAALQSLGLEHAAVYSNDVSGLLPVSQIEAAAARGEVTALRAAMSRPRAAAGPVATQGDYAQRTDVIRAAHPSLTGKGVTVALMSDSFNCYLTYSDPTNQVPVSGPEGYAPNGFTADYASDIATGALPSNVQVVLDDNCLGYQSPDYPDNQPTGLPLTDEGRAMAQVVYAIAPEANILFRTGALGEADFASAIVALATAPSNAQIIVDDLGYFDEPFFQDGVIAQAIDTVKAQGVAYFSAAGNDQSTPSYMNTSPSFKTLSTTAPNSGEYLLNFDATGATTVTSLPVTIPPLPPGDFVAVVVEWDQPYLSAAPDSGGATSQIDVCLTGSAGTDVLLNYDNTVTNCSGANELGQDPYQVMLIANPAVGSADSAQVTINIQVGLVGGTKAPGRIIVAVEDDGQGSTINAFSPNGPTIQGHPGAAGAAAVGAAFYYDTPRCGTTPAKLEPYSSSGGAPILFDATGAPQAAEVRQKPDFVAPDGVNDTFLGFTLASDSPPYPANGLFTTSITQCQNNPSYPNFFGTSTATPHAAAAAALMLQANPTATPDQIYSALRNSASAMGAVPNLNAGYGFIQADAALALLGTGSGVPAAPTLTLGATSITLGASTTITWSSTGATSCTASGSWSGTLATSGTQTLKPTAAGTDTYSLTCSNTSGASKPTTATLTVTNATGTVPAAPTLTLDPTSIAVGATTTITWSSSNATSCTASESSSSAGDWTGTKTTNGNQTLTPAAAGSYTYTLKCANATGTSSPATATLTVTAGTGGTPPAAPTLTLGAASITLGASTTITWSSANATSCTASGSWSGTLATSGTQTLKPTAVDSYTYTLKCANATGTSSPTTATLKVAAATTTAPATPSLHLASTTIAAGTTTTITWSSSNATMCTESGSWNEPTVATDGTMTLKPASAGTYTYSLSCSNGAGNSPLTSQTLTVTAASSGSGSSSSGGGGKLDGLSLLGLATLLVGLRVRANGGRARPDRAAHAA
jgi:plastocyanin